MSNVSHRFTRFLIRIGHAFLVRIGYNSAQIKDRASLSAGLNLVMGLLLNSTVFAAMAAAVAISRDMSTLGLAITIMLTFMIGFFILPIILSVATRIIYYLFDYTERKILGLMTR